jgi:hypothetical protein
LGFGKNRLRRRIFPRRITRIGTKGTRGKSGTGNGVFLVLVLFEFSLVTYPGKYSTKIGATSSSLVGRCTM